VPRRESPVGRPQPLTPCVTCEHASWHAPEGAALDADLRRSHVGWDAGALDAAAFLGRVLGVPVFAGSFTRLWVDLNRSADAPGVIPVRSFGVDVPANRIADPDRQARLAAYWHPWRARVAGHIQALRAQGPVLHVSVHTFTPELDSITPAAEAASAAHIRVPWQPIVSRHAPRSSGAQAPFPLLRGARRDPIPARRTYPLGVLFDPARAWEADVAAHLIAAVPDARANEPYAGTDDGHTTSLRAVHPDPHYAGIELEFNQALLGTSAWTETLERVARALTSLPPPRPAS
jgi:predicted N-formylglutamate amidohydrolase